MANESRVLDCFGPNLVIESNGPVGLGGAIAYQLYATTDKDRAKWQQALHGSGPVSYTHLTLPTSDLV